MGIGDWGLGIGDWGWGTGTNPQNTIPKTQSHYIQLLFNLLKTSLLK